MACLRTYYHGNYIVVKNKFFMVRPVKNKIKRMLRVLIHYTFERFKGKPPDAFEPVVEQQTGINSNIHVGPD